MSKEKTNKDASAEGGSDHINELLDGQTGVEETAKEGGGQVEGRAATGKNEVEKSSLSAELEIARERLGQFENEITELQDRSLRKQAEFENFRKRLERDKSAAISFANRALLLDLIFVIDDLERAMAAVDQNRDYDVLHDGVVLIEKQLIGMLERKWGLKRFNSAGVEFDPERHEAVTSEEVDDIEHSAVQEEYQKGYLLHDKVLRAAKVKVGVPKRDPTG